MKPTTRCFLFCAALLLTLGCGETEPTTTNAEGCDSEPVLLKTADGVEYVRTPDACFENLPDWQYEAKYVEIDGLRQAYIDEGPADAAPILLLHGQPSWSYLYRKMIPVLVADGHRVIAMDHLGMGRSDKPIDITRYSYLDHTGRLERFIEQLDLQDITLFVQDWGSLVGLKVAGENLDRFARISVGDGALPVIPEGVRPFAPVEAPDTSDPDLEFPFGDIPAQQSPLYDENCELLIPQESRFGEWMTYAMKGLNFRPSEVLEALTWFDLPSQVEAAYDAPFPSRIYMGGPRTFPSLINQVPGTTQAAWDALGAFERPFLTIWANNDTGSLGSCKAQQTLIEHVPGSVAQPHTRLPEASHFLQDDQGEEIARRLSAFVGAPRRYPMNRGRRYCEVLLVRMGEDGLEAEVWGTPVLSECPAEAWEALDPEQIKADTGALEVIMNGPRFWLTDRVRSEQEISTIQTFGELMMSRLATLKLEPGMAGTATYEPHAVVRTTTYTLNKGSEVYEITTQGGDVFLMQSMSQIIDPNQRLEDLASLGERLTLPEGWTYQARTLTETLELDSRGEAIVMADELGNTYQRSVEGEASMQMLPVTPDGTGTVCTSDAECAGLAAAHCLQGPNGPGYCTVQGCAPSACGDGYACCGSCNEAIASMLPFEGSACVPAGATGQLSSVAGCTCE